MKLKIRTFFFTDPVIIDIYHTYTHLKIMTNNDINGQKLMAVEFNLIFSNFI